MKVFVEDDMTMNTAYLRLNDDFSLFYEVNSVPSIDPLLDHRNLRIKWQMRLFRRSPIVGLIENKLLCHSLLTSLGIPKAEIYYGAFASQAMGEWPQYNRSDFISTLSNIPQVSEDHLFVIKPATGEDAHGAIVMNHKKWVDGGWNLDRLANHVEALFSVSDSFSGQQFEHLGVLVQQSVLSQESNTEFHTGSFESNSSLVFELKPHVVFGTLCGGSLNLVPFNPKHHLNIDFCSGEPRSRFTTDANNPIWESLRPRIQAERIAKIAKRIAYAFGVDLFRLDVFVDLNGMFLVNEVTYPSYEHPARDCTYGRFYNYYKSEWFHVLEPRSVLEPLLRRIDVPYDEFMESSDYQYMTDWSEEEWDAYIESLYGNNNDEFPDEDVA